MGEDAQTHVCKVHGQHSAFRLKGGRTMRCMLCDHDRLVAKLRARGETRFVQCTRCHWPIRPQPDGSIPVTVRGVRGQEEFLCRFCADPLPVERAHLEVGRHEARNKRVNGGHPMRGASS